MINIEALKLHFEGDEELIGELLEVFDESYPKVLTNLKEALSQKNFSEIELHAHTLKGMVSNFFADELKNAAANLEKMGRDKVDTNFVQDLKKIEELLPKLTLEVKGMLA